MIHDISLAPKNNVVQNLAMTRGRELYEDTDGTWKLPSNAAVLDGSKGRIRPIQTGRGYIFTSTDEIIETPVPVQTYTDAIDITVIVDITAGGTTSARVVSSYNGAGVEFVFPFNQLMGLHVFYNSGVANFRTANLSGTQLTGIHKYRVLCTDLSDPHNTTTFWIDDVEYAPDNLGSGGTIQPFTAGKNISVGKRTGGVGDNSTVYYVSYHNSTTGDKFIYNCEEQLGLVAFDASGNGNHGVINLNGTAEGSFHTTNNQAVSYANDYGYNKGAYFDGTNHGLIGGSFTIPSHWEFIIGLIPTEESPSDYDSPFGQSGVGHNFKVEYRTAELGFNFRVSAGTTATIDFGVNSFVAYKYTELRVTYINGEIKSYLDGVLVDTQTITVDSFSLDALHVGTEELNSATRKMEGIYSKLILNELDSGGSTIANLIELDWRNGDSLSIPNIASDAPASTDMAWDSPNDIYSIIIPVNQAIPTQDVLGNVLPAEYTGEVSYDALVKSSSVASFDGNLYGEFFNGALNTDPDWQMQGFDIQFGINTTSVATQTSVFANSKSDTTAGGFYIYRTSTTNIGLAYVDSGGVNQFSSQGSISAGYHDFRFRKKPSSTTLEIWVDGVLYNKTMTSSTIKYLPVGQIIVIGARYNFPGVTYQYFHFGPYNYFKLDTIDDNNDVVKSLMDFKFSENNGTIWYNTAVDAPANSNAAVILNGSTDGDQWATSELQYPKNLIEGFNRAAYFDGTTYASNTATLSLTNYEFEINIIFNDPTATRYEYVVGTPSFNILKNNNGTTIRIPEFPGTNVAHNGKPVNRFVVRNFSTTSAIITLNGVEVYNGAGFGVGTFTNFIIGNYFSGGFPFYGSISYLRVAELDGGGTEISEPYLLDFDNADETTIPNIGADAPASSDMVWDSVNGEYVNIPADPSNPTNDVNGNPLQIIGDGKIINSAENVYDRNYADAPALVAAGIAQGEDISYEDITADISKFYRDRGTWVQDLLTYSDFVEPMSSGGYNMTNNQYVTYPSNDTLTPANGDTIEVSCRINFNSTVLQRIWHVGGGTVYQNVEFIIYSTSDLRIGSPGVTLSYDNPNIVTGQWYDFRVVAVNNQAFDTIELWQDGVKYLTTGTRANLINISTIEAIMGNLLAVVASGGLNGIVSDFAIKVNGVVQAEYHYEENGGLVSYDISGNGNHGLLTTNGASLDSIHVADTAPQYIHNLKYGKVTAGYFRDYLKLPYRSNYHVQYSRLEFDIWMPNFDQRFGINIQFERTLSGGNKVGWMLYVERTDQGTPGQLKYTANSVSSLTVQSSVGAIIAGQWNTVTMDMSYSGTTLTANLSINGNPETVTIPNAYLLGTPVQLNPFLIGAVTQSTDSTTVTQYTGNNTVYLKNFKFSQLNSGGSVINEFVVPDWKSGDASVVPNIAADAIDAELDWNATSGAYSKVPGDPSNIGFDIGNQAIDNQAEVTKYNRINNYLTK